jgi:hypothetical protein
MGKEPPTAQTEGVNPSRVSAVANLDDYRHREQVREAKRVFQAFEAAVWDHIRQMVKRALDKPRRPRPELVVDSDASGEPRQGRGQHLRQIDT